MALKVMGMPGSIHQRETQYYQTKMFVVKLVSNNYGYGINLDESDGGVVRIMGCRPNPDGTPSPSMQNSNIKQGDAIYKVQDTVLKGPNVLNQVCDC